MTSLDSSFAASAPLDIGVIPSGGAGARLVEYNRLICHKLQSIGLNCRHWPDAGEFLPGITIANGGVLVDLDKALPASLLHEASHLALMSPSRRRQAGSDINAIYACMRHDALVAGWDRNDVRYGAMLAAGEDRAAYALAWAWGSAWNLPVDVVMFPQGSYGLSIDELRCALEAGIFPGVDFLEQALLVTKGEFPKLRSMTQILDPQDNHGRSDIVKLFLSTIARYVGANQAQSG